MSADPLEELLSECVSFIGVQRQLIEHLSDVGQLSGTVNTAMIAELDRFAAAVRQAQQQIIPRRNRPAPGDPGE
jgi:hypothetical protein